MATLSSYLSGSAFDSEMLERISRMESAARTVRTPVVSEARIAPDTITESYLRPTEKTGLFRGAIDAYKVVDKRATAKIADVFNVTPKTVETVSLIGLIGTGAGLLANGVKSLFDGTMKEKRLERKAERQQKRATKRGAAMAEAFKTIDYGQGTPIAGGVAPVQGAGMMAGATDFLQKNWMLLALAGLVVFGGKLFKPKRRAPRRRPKPKVVTRYRTRKAPIRKRR